MTTILAIAGSPTYPSRTYNLLEYSAQQLQNLGIQTEILSVEELAQRLKQSLQELTEVVQHSKVTSESLLLAS